ncbi:MAG: TonB-dependent hemoglobin/transferrin/lactoferrin family receptor [Cohaesibacter sp.]|nr:TonB-dependent hemoglobin/transferrin/lactoferrin family receptor [Cohaesibacter sp.]
MHRVILVALAASTILLPVSELRAQSAGTAESRTLASSIILDRIVVSAGEEKIAADTPQAVTVLNQEDIDEALPETIGDVFKFIPGVSTVGSERVLGESFNIRGIGTASASDESKIIMQVDGVPKFYEQYRMGSLFLDPELLKRVEVLRGPASSTLYGSGAFGGVITMATKDASDFLAEGQSWAFKPKITASSNGAGLVTTAIAATRLNEAFEVLASGSLRKADNYKDGDGKTLDRSDYQTESGLLNAKYKFGADIEQYLRLSAMYFHSDMKDGEYNQTGGGSFGQTDRVTTDLNLAAEYVNPFTDNKYLDLKVNLGFSDTVNDQDNLKNGSVGFFGNSAKYSYRTYVAKFENTSNLSTSDFFQNYLTVGSEYSHQKRSGERTIGATTSAISFQPEGTQEKASVFAQSEMIIADKLTLIPGIRYDYFMNKGTAASGNKSSDIGAVSPKLAAIVALNDNLSVFGSAAYTERAPTLDELYSTSGTRSGVSLDLKTEKSKNIEAGFSVKFDDVLFENDRFRAKVTAFHNNITNLIESRSRTGPTYYHNVGEARIHGIEVEAGYDWDYAFARASYAATRGHDSATNVNLDSIAADSLVTSLGVRLPDYDLKLSWDATFAADQERIGNGRGSRRTGGYATHDLKAVWKPQSGTFAGLDAKFSIENVLDRSYRRHLSDDPARGRTFKFSLSRSFGG